MYKFRLDGKGSGWHERRDSVSGMWQERRADQIECINEQTNGTGFSL